MPSPFSKLRDKIPPRLVSVFRRKWHWKDVAIAVLALLVATVSAYAFREPLAAAAARFRAGAQGGETVSVFDVVLDRDNRQYVDFLFDRPLGEGRQGEVLDQAPATITPVLGGSWTWKDTNALRFEPSGGFPVASEFEFELIPDRIIREGQVFTGETEHKVRTDQFLVENVEAIEEPALEGKAMVFYHGNVRFNYAVDPKVLAPRIRLVDPRRPQPIPVELETGWESRVIAFRTQAVQKEKDERTVELVISQDLTPTGGNAPLTEEFRHEIPVGSSTKLTVRDVVAEPGPRESILRVRFSSPISAAVVEKYLTLEPAARVRLSAARNELQIAGELKPGQTYKLTLGKGLPATDDAVLAEEYTTEIKIPDLEPKVDFQSQGMFLSATGNRTVALESVNVPKVKMTIDRVYLNNLFFLFQYGGFFGEDYGYFGEVHQALGDRLDEVTLDVGGAKNQRRVVPVKLDRYINVKEPGLYRFSVGQPDAWEAAQRWVLLTDLGAVVKRGRGEMMVWVSSLTDLSPVDGVEVRLISDKNQTLAEGTTDGSGLWRVSDAKALAKGTPYMLTFEKGDDFSFLLLSSMQIDTAGLDVGGDEPPGEGYRAFLYGERDLYRPGEKVEGLAIVRNGAIETPPAMPARLTHIDPQGRNLSTRTLRFDERGLGPFTLDLPAYSLTGNHTLEVQVAEKVIGQYRFQVEEFVPDRISVEIVPPKEKVGPGQELAYQVHSAYLFGPPAAGLPAESRVRLVDSNFAPKGFESFRFRNDERTLEDREVLSTEGTLDQEGRTTFQVTMPAGAPVPSSLEAVITARVQEQGGRGVAAMERVRVHPYPYYVGLRRLGQDYPEPGRDVDFEFVSVSPDGKEVPSGALRADLFEDRWNTVMRKTPSGGYRYESTRDSVLVDSRPVAGGKSRGRFQFRPRNYGSYRVVLTDPDTQASAEVSMSAVGWGYSPWAIQNPSRLELTLDRPEGQDYAPGETATVEVKAPFAGKLLVTVERDQVLYSEVHTLSGNTARIEVPIRSEFRPNAYVTATLVRRAADLEPGSVGRAFGAVPLPVDRTANHLKPEIVAPAEIRPNTKLQVAVKAQPGSVVTVAAVDEGILQLIAQKTPDPFDFFYRKLALEVTSYDTFSLLLPEVKPAPAGGGDGADGLAQYVRTEGIRRVEPVAFWSGPVVADGEGNAKVSFQVPEFQGALRLMAVAIQGDELGSAERKTRVRTPLVLTPTLPRILSFNETLQVPVTVRNDTAKSGPVQVQMEATGPVRIDGPATQSVDVPVGRERTIYFTVKTGGAGGDARFVVTANGHGERSRSTTGVPVRGDLPPVTTERSGAVNNATTEVPASGIGGDTEVRQIRVSPLPLVQFAGRLEHLLHYPYGCLEQTTSSAFPLIYLGDLARALAPEVLDPKKGRGDPAEMIQAGVRRIATMQIAGGGFSLWPGSQEVHPWGSIYATHFLVEARRAGHPVEDSLYRNALTWVAGQVRAKSNYGTEELQRMVYGLYVLGRAGRPDVGTMDFLRRKHLNGMPAETKALLAAAYAAAGNPRALEDLIAGLGEIEQIERQTGGNFNSVIRNRALLLLALLDAQPRSPRIPALVDRLARDGREVPLWTTQEESFTLLALGQFVQRQTKQPPYSGTVFVGGKKIGTFTNQTATFTNVREDGPVRIQMNAGFKPGSAFYSVLSRGIPTDQQFKPANEGLEIERAFLDRSGQAVSLNGLRQGDLVVIQTRVRSVVGPIHNVAVVNLLPSGLEVENPRLETTEQLPWISDAAPNLDYLDLRDDRILLFVDLPSDTWQTYYTLVRAVAPGSFRLPPVQAEAMYNPAIRSTSERGTVEVKRR